MDKQDMIRRMSGFVRDTMKESGETVFGAPQFVTRKQVATFMGKKDPHQIDWALSGLERTADGKMYYMRPGEEEERENMRRQAKKIGTALTGKKTPPTAAIIKKLKDKAMGYYDSCAFPKPQDKKKKKKVNGYKGKADRVCAYTGRPFAERHEIFCGRNRQISIDNGFQIDVCPEIHAELQENITEWAQAENLRLRQKCQSEYEDTLISSGITPDEARELWLKLIGRSYL